MTGVREITSLKKNSFILWLKNIQGRTKNIMIQVVEHMSTIVRSWIWALALHGAQSIARCGPGGPQVSPGLSSARNGPYYKIFLKKFKKSKQYCHRTLPQTNLHQALLGFCFLVCFFLDILNKLFLQFQYLQLTVSYWPQTHKLIVK